MIFQFVKVLSVTDSRGVNIDNTKVPTEEEEKLQSATITVLASPEQAKLITAMENDGVAHVALISRGNDTLAGELLSVQEQVLMEIYHPEELQSEEDAQGDTPGQTEQKPSANPAGQESAVPSEDENTGES